MHPRPFGLDDLPGEEIRTFFAEHKCEEHPGLRDVSGNRKGRFELGMGGERIGGKH
jgi:hypothetical protein